MNTQQHPIPTMMTSRPTPSEATRYKDSRGDTIVIKFYPSLIPSLAGLTRHKRRLHFPPTPLAPNDPTKSRLQSTPIPGPIEIYHEWRQETAKAVTLYSNTLDVEGAIERFDKDKLPARGFILWDGIVQGKRVRARWLGFRDSELGCVFELV
ncbi:unnamed protein product [Periconia digitata]|uniref:Uncharacterized protein n=1 Tax=Periconia digitata TaxID=1303443 RepID=A0A9W4XPC5_9PLEO|nr:unnamed protein product [Periconia digitata]